MRTCVKLAPFLFLAACGAAQDAMLATATPGGAPDAGAGSPAAQPGLDGGPIAAACLASPVLSQLGTAQKLLVGADMDESVAELARFDIRYLYLAGGLSAGTGPCSSCGACSGGSVWWGCWQGASLPPGQYVRDLIAKTQNRGQLPLISYYELLQTSKVSEGPAEIVALRDPALMARYFNDWRFVLQQVGDAPALLHLEPDLWGYAQQLDGNPHHLAAAVAKANPSDCAGQEDSVAGFGRCLIAMVRRYAPHAKVGLHASAWGTGVDAHGNTDPRLDVAAEARKLADFLLACGATDSDFVVVEASDRDAGYYKSQGRNTFWDATNATLPSFHQAFTWTQALTERLQKPALWWQLPLGNMSLPNVVHQWQDNRVDYFFSHPAEVARTNAFGMVFGAGDAQQTNPSTDRGNFVTSVQRLVAGGGQAACQ